uniref:Fucosyltransferase n=1 Tax=Ciona savignyi TaxID=51511 RepID=H2ZL49_CIOSA
KGLILIWATVIMPGEIPIHPMCGGGCDVTNDRSRFDDADAVVFMMKSTNRNDLPDPKKRRANQAFVWWSRESAWTAKYFYRKTLDDFDDYFNWTMTHRRDSDVNGMLYPFIAPESLLFPDHVTPTDNHLMEPKIRDVIKQKTGVVAWVASNCDFTEGAKQRLKVVKEVQRSGVKVDIYGRCGNLSIGGNPFYPTLSKYKFYFAFENGVHCRGYITEKLWFNSFYSGAVPIVWGPTKDDVTSVSPPNSFIHVDDFETTSQLTDYLKYLDNNVTAYTEYLAWRWEVPGYFPLVGVNDREYQGELRKAKNHFNNAFCELCRFIKGGLNQVFHKTVPSLKRFWFDPESEDCL